ncbi:MAG: MerR family transcriptional regulator [Magnetovibrionaceae bacterium]
MADNLDQQPSFRQDKKSAAAFRTISEVATELDLPQHVLRFWETKFPQVKPLKRGGGRRYYRPEDLTLLNRIKSLLYEDGYTIKGVQKLLRQAGVRAVINGEGSSAQPTEAEGDFERLDGLNEDVHGELSLLLDELKQIRAELNA